MFSFILASLENATIFQLQINQIAMVIFFHDELDNIWYFLGYFFQTVFVSADLKLKYGNDKSRMIRTNRGKSPKGH